MDLGRTSSAPLDALADGPGTSSAAARLRTERPQRHRRSASAQHPPSTQQGQSATAPFNADHATVTVGGSTSSADHEPLITAHITTYASSSLPRTSSCALSAACGQNVKETLTKAPSADVHAIITFPAYRQSYQGSAAANAAAAAAQQRPSTPSRGIAHLDLSALSRATAIFQDLYRASANLARGSSPGAGCGAGARECRICLSPGCAGDLVAPCTCTGSVRYVHLDCLRSWAAERRSVVCELCKQPYREDVAHYINVAVMSVRQINQSGLAVPPPGPARAARRAAVGLEEAIFSWTTGIIYALLLGLLVFALVFHFVFQKESKEDHAKEWQLKLWNAVLIAGPSALGLRLMYDMARYWRMRRLYRKANELEEVETATLMIMRLEAAEQEAEQARRLVTRPEQEQGDGV